MIGEDGRPLPRITNTALPKEREKCNRKSSTLHSATSDMHLLWGGQHSNSSTSRPASMIFNDNGLVRFRTQMENDKFQEIQKGNFSADEVPPGYLEHIYNVSYQRKPEYLIREQNYNDAEDKGQMQQLLQNRIVKEMYGKAIKENGPSNSVVSDPNTEYSYSEIASSIPNDEYGRYASACSSVSAANSFDVRMYDDYEVASYYHSPINGAKSTASSHVYASLRPTHPNLTPHKTVRNARIPTGSCFSSPQSAVSSNRSNQSPRHSNLHNSDSDLCSSATDRTQASSSQGNDENNEKYDNGNFQRPMMKRHLSHPNALPDDSDMPLDVGKQRTMEKNMQNNQGRKLGKRDINADYPKVNTRYSPIDSDDIYTPLMEQHLDSKSHPNSPPMKYQQQQPQNVQQQQKYQQQQPQNLQQQRQFQLQQQLYLSQANSPIIFQSHRVNQNFEPQNEAVHQYNINSEIVQCESPSGDVPVLNQKHSPYRSSPSSPVYQNNEPIPKREKRGTTGSSTNYLNSSNTVNQTPISPSRSRSKHSDINNESNVISLVPTAPSENKDDEEVYHNDDNDVYSNDEIANVVPFARPTPPPIPQRPSLAETWVFHQSDGATGGQARTEIGARKNSRTRNGHGNHSSPVSPTNSVPSPVSPVSNI